MIAGPDSHPQARLGPALAGFFMPFKPGHNARTMITATLLCLVVGISDGDTLKARCGEPGAYQEIKVRLAEIDAPEKRQAYGEASKRTLAALCAGVQAKITPETTDRYGRTVAHVECRGRDANTEQVRAGMAWVYDRYVHDRSLYAVQDHARSAGRGLWSEKMPTAPWDWRQTQR